MICLQIVTDPVTRIRAGAVTLDRVLKLYWLRPVGEVGEGASGLRIFESWWTP